ncbi:hypothetical protein KCV06_g490, partial [Aureobasidium melanogenum]
MNTRDSVRQLESNTGAARWPQQGTVAGRQRERRVLIEYYEHAQTRRFLRRSNPRPFTENSLEGQPSTVWVISCGDRTDYKMQSQIEHCKR